MDSRNLTTRETVCIAANLWVKAFRSLDAAKKHFGRGSVLSLDLDPKGFNHLWTVSGAGIETQKVVIQEIA